MKNFAPLILVFLLSFSIPSNASRKSLYDCALFETIESLSEALMDFFDTTNNHESFDKHVNRFYEFNIILYSKISNKSDLFKDFEENKSRYYMDFGDFITFEQFKSVILDLKANFDVLCRDLINQTVKRSAWAICRTFKDFKDKLTEIHFNTRSKFSIEEISAYKIWTIVRYRLSVKD